VSSPRSAARSASAGRTRCVRAAHDDVDAHVHRGRPQPDVLEPLDGALPGPGATAQAVVQRRVAAVDADQDLRDAGGRQGVHARGVEQPAVRRDRDVQLEPTGAADDVRQLRAQERLAAEQVDRREPQSAQLAQHAEELRGGQLARHERRVARRRLPDVAVPAAQVAAPRQLDEHHQRPGRTGPDEVGQARTRDVGQAAQERRHQRPPPGRRSPRWKRPSEAPSSSSSAQ